MFDMFSYYQISNDHMALIDSMSKEWFIQIDGKSSQSSKESSFHEDFASKL